MAITEMGESIQIRIKYSDGVKLRAMQIQDKEPWNEIVSRLIERDEKRTPIRKPEIQSTPIHPDAQPGSEMFTVRSDPYRRTEPKDPEGTRQPVPGLL
jgi:hypothetical protein